jgi:hypothetical protein
LRMTNASRVSAALASILVAMACLVVLVFILAKADFLIVIRGGILHILVISIVAGLVRLPFKRGGLALSAICGAAVAATGFFIVLAIAVSNI